MKLVGYQLDDAVLVSNHYNVIRIHSSGTGIVVAVRVLSVGRPDTRHQKRPFFWRYTEN
jgi:hypothetical protein